MAIIGTFTKTADGFSGTVRTLTLTIKASIFAADKEHDKSPDYRVRTGAVDIGAAWAKTSAAERSYLSVKLDDPSLPAPIYATLAAADDGESFNLIWSR